MAGVSEGANVAVGGMVEVGVRVGARVRVMVGVRVEVAVDVGVGESVHAIIGAGVRVAPVVAVGAGVRLAHAAKHRVASNRLKQYRGEMNFAGMGVAPPPVILSSQSYRPFSAELPLGYQI